MSSDSLDEIVKNEMKQRYGADKKNWLATDEIREKTPGLFKPEVVGTRSVWLTAECYLVQNQNKTGKYKYSCKGVSKKHNDLNFERYKDGLDVFQRTKINSECKMIKIKPRIKDLEFKIKAL